MTIKDKHDIILAHERRFAARVALKVIDKPELSLWMVLIPIFFVFYYFQFKRYKNGVKAFSQQFITTRKRVLGATYDAISHQQSVNIMNLVEATDVPHSAKENYRQWIELLVEHFHSLLIAEGQNYEELIRQAQKRKSNYLIHLKQLNTVEHRFNTSLIEKQQQEKEKITDVVNRMNMAVVDLRRLQAEQIFSA